MIEGKELEAFIKPAPGVALVDVRSEGEFAKGHIPGAINIPLLTNEQRVQVGTLYKQMGKEAAVMKGFQLVGPQFYDRFKAMRKASGGEPLHVYCWRGGMRSNIMAWMMNLADYRVSVLRGGYKAYRQFAHELFSRPWQWIILAGKTGVGKTDLLRQLELRGEQVLDYEGLANHKGSAFGHIGLPPQPTVEHFENLIAWKLKDFNPDLPLWVENESRFLGQVRLPDALFNQTLPMPVVELERDLDSRRKLIWADYGRHPVDQLIEATEKITRKLGGDRMKMACDSLQAGNWENWLNILLLYYDKTYAHSRQAHTGPTHTLLLSGDLEEDAEKLIQLKETIWKKQEA